MPKVTVYLPDDIYARFVAYRIDHDWTASGVVQDALDKLLPHPRICPVCQRPTPEKVAIKGSND